jgi:hypothetical protein
MYVLLLMVMITHRPTAMHTITIVRMLITYINIILK